MYPSVFTPQTNVDLIARIGQLTPDTQPQWGKMAVAQMMAHCSVAYDIAYEKIPVKFNWFMRQMLTFLVKPTVVGTKPYKKNTQTASVFVIDDERDFETEKQRLIDNIKQVEASGADYFDGKESPSFGRLSAQEWSNQFWKHLDHHLTQFGV